MHIANCPISRLSSCWQQHTCTPPKVSVADQHDELASGSLICTPSLATHFSAHLHQSIYFGIGPRRRLCSTCIETKARLGRRRWDGFLHFFAYVWKVFVTGACPCARCRAGEPDAQLLLHALQFSIWNARPSHVRINSVQCKYPYRLIFEQKRFGAYRVPLYIK